MYAYTRNIHMYCVHHQYIDVRFGVCCCVLCIHCMRVLVLYDVCWCYTMCVWMCVLCYIVEFVSVIVDCMLLFV